MPTWPATLRSPGRRRTIPPSSCPIYSTGLVWAAPVRKDNVELRRKLDVAIECMKRDGTLAKMHEKWFGTKPVPGSAAATIYPGYGVPDMPGYDASEHPATCS